MVVFIRFLLLIIDVDGSNRANLVLDKGLVLKYSLYFRSGKRLTRGEIDSKRIIELFGVYVCVCVCGKGTYNLYLITLLTTKTNKKMENIG